MPHRRPTAAARPVLWLVPIFLALHNAEEALTFRRYLPLVRAAAPSALRPIVSAVTYPQMLVALAVATAVPLLLTVLAVRHPASRAALWGALAVQAVVALNVASHVAAAAWLGGYAPGLVTALLVNLPFSVYLFRRVIRERWVSRRAAWALVPTALIVHGPGLLGVIALAGRIAGSD